MNNRHRKILMAIFADPVSGTIAWADIEALLIALGCDVVEGSGSRVRFVNGSEIESFHRPHPAKDAKRYQVRAARDFIRRMGGQP
ncbi:HicA-like toxin of HicAB toxin-antitoxin system [Rhizobium sp. PP-F2F-G48]|uniref:type II toxin-antitoxin system HicA family toxin n=1 Tax=Rhizobium sp. PP-F2F-G48 TaxID=2135651 RepID=UPI00104762AC|nr:type II toxin-antitoxin system HicA family toxin [Rhizobium sp. PP-F2F-G48]TCM55712.1 HicA-like toxin of HicAB toxin-antitoxin system [Rhizobium sp. PP-F2F-G48]